MFVIRNKFGCKSFTAPFATFVDSDVRESIMDASLRSSDSSSDSICSLSRRKLFFEDNDPPASGKNDSFLCSLDQEQQTAQEHDEQHNQT